MYDLENEYKQKLKGGSIINDLTDPTKWGNEINDISLDGMACFEYKDPEPNVDIIICGYNLHLCNKYSDDLKIYEETNDDLYNHHISKCEIETGS